MQCIDESIILTSAQAKTFPPKNNESGRAGRVEGKEKKMKVKVRCLERRGLRGAVPLRCRCGTKLRVCLGKEVTEGQEVQT